MKGKKVHALDQDFVPEDTLYSVLDSFNQMYGTSSSTWCARSAPSRRTCSRSTWARLREARKDVFAGVKLQKDGTLDAAVVERNLNKFPEDAAARPSSWTRLNELLYAELLAVKRTLGAEHEAALVRAFRDR